MKKILVIIVLPLFVLFACEKSKNTGDATEDLAWLKAKKTEWLKNCGECGHTIFQYQYQGVTIYATSCSAPACDCVMTFYDKNGNEIKKPENQTYADFTAKMTEQKLLWQCR